MILKLEGADFSKKNIGKIDIPTSVLTGITINGMSSATGSKNVATYTCTASYDDGTSKSVNPVWNITSGSSYASISGDGVLTIKSGANNSPVVITASYQGKTNTKNVTVTYDNGMSSWGKAVALLQTKYSVDSDEMLAYDTFRKTLSASGVLSKIEALYVPAMGATLGDSFVNLVADTPSITSYSGDNNSIVSKKENGGLYSKATAFADYNNSFMTLPTNPVNTDNCTCFTGIVGTGNPSGVILGVGTRNSGLSSYHNNVNNNAYARLAYYDTTTHSITSSKPYDGQNIISFGTNTGSQIQVNGNGIETRSNADATSVGSKSNILVYAGSFGDQEGLGLMMFGVSKVALTDSEMQIIQNAYLTFSESMGWN